MPGTRLASSSGADLEFIPLDLLKAEMSLVVIECNSDVKLQMSDALVATFLR